MKKFLNIFFVALGVIFFIIILAGAYLYVFDPFNLKSLFSKNSLVQTSSTQIKKSTLSDTQQKALKTIGVDPSTIPTSFTPEQETCFIKILGAVRVSEIKAGSSPTVSEYIEAKSCL